MSLIQERDMWKHRALAAEAIVAKFRSPHWPVERAAHIKIEPLCQACRTDKFLQVHHIVPFHDDPTKELDQLNLITLCETPGKNCHLNIGHLGNWHKINPDVREWCKTHGGKL